ncbi:hypothetical protein B0O99DRAFT_686263 [Bisporella sp. PMI_857]|nr:hypothetical protein B0O99DRAFT_686263 [Bisporella sp. PMI_857]
MDFTHSISEKPLPRAPSSALQSAAGGGSTVLDIAEQRRIQNRINQREYRKALKKNLEDLDKYRHDESSSASFAKVTPDENTYTYAIEPGEDSVHPVSIKELSEHAADSIQYTRRPEKVSLTGEGEPNEDYIAQPPIEKEVERLFAELMQSRGWNNLPNRVKQQMIDYPASKKWSLIHHDRLRQDLGKQKPSAMLDLKDVPNSVQQPSSIQKPNIILQYRECDHCVTICHSARLGPGEAKYCPRHQCPVKYSEDMVCFIRKKATEKRCLLHTECLIPNCKAKRTLDNAQNPNDYCHEHTCSMSGCVEAKLYHEKFCAEHDQAGYDFEGTFKEDGNVSIASQSSGDLSIQSIADSIFSAISGSSRSSIMESQEAGQRFATLLLRDGTINLLCVEALEWIKVGRLERQVRKLLKQFGLDLRKEAGTRDETITAHFVRYRARNSAHLICNSFQKPKEDPALSRQLREQFLVGQENDSDDDIDSIYSDNPIEDLPRLETFIQESEAMQRLRESLGEFVRLITIGKGNYRTRDESLATPTSPRIIFDTGKNEDKSSDEDSEEIEYGNNSSYDSESEIWGTPLTSPQSTPRLRFQSQLDDISDEDDDALVWWDLEDDRVQTNETTELTLTGNSSASAGSPSSWNAQIVVLMETAFAYFRAPPVAPEMTRMSWKCVSSSPLIQLVLRFPSYLKFIVDTQIIINTSDVCGYKSYDDFKELKPGASQRLQLEISGELRDNPGSLISKARHAFLDGLSNLTSIFSARSTQSSEPGLPLHQVKPESNEACKVQPQLQDPESPPPELIYLLLCYNVGRYATRLLQLDLIEFKAHSDLTLFKLLRENYESMRGPLRRWISLHTLTNIKFVQFEIHVGELVDVRRQDIIPPPEHKDYRYNPVPPELIPPVGERYMMHLFHHPSSAHTSSICLDRFPKKLLQKLTASPTNPSPGWGLHFVESWDNRKITGLIFFLFLSSSLLFGVLWSVYEHDTQSAFAISSYMVAFAGITVITVQAFLHL